jgi:GNAT superfamily N-acetyltransferase
VRIGVGDGRVRGEPAPGIRLSLEDRASQEDRDAIGNALDAYNREFLGDTGFTRVCFFVRNGRGEIMAGLVGSNHAGWLFVADLWVHAELHRRGVGRELLARAERRAVELGCHSVRLDTFSFESPVAWAFLAGHSCDAFFQLVDGLLRPRTRVPPVPPSQPPLGVTPPHISRSALSNSDLRSDAGSRGASA